MIAQGVALWLPTSENINALPQPVRDYIHALETNADPSGTVAANTFLKDQCNALQVLLVQARAALAQAMQDAARWRALRNVPDDQLGAVGVACISVPSVVQGGYESGVHVNGVDADELVDAAIAALTGSA